MNGNRQIFIFFNRGIPEKGYYRPGLFPSGFCLGFFSRTLKSGLSFFLPPDSFSGQSTNIFVDIRIFQHQLNQMVGAALTNAKNLTCSAKFKVPLCNLKAICCLYHGVKPDISRIFRKQNTVALEITSADTATKLMELSKPKW